MASSSNYQDPDYPGTSSEPTPDIESPTSREKAEKIKTIIRREFSKEVEVREKEMVLLDQRLQSARHLMARLRYNIVKRYYEHDGLKLTSAQIKDYIDAQTEPGAKAEVASLLREQQHNIHPSLKKLLGKKTVDMSEIFTAREPRNKTKKDYVAMLKRPTASKPQGALRPLPKRPCTAPPEPLPPKKVPRLPAVQTINEVTRNQKRDRFRIIIGNTSKYAPPASKADRSTHKWLLYIRGPPSQPELGAIVTRVSLTLHHSYAPHHIVHIDKPPFHVSRRGWGEFPVKVEIHFPMPNMNRPATIEHTIKLDRNYTGLQTLGSETVVDVYLYSTEEMLQYVYKEGSENALAHLDPNLEDKPKELPLIEPDKNEIWLDFLSNEKPINIDEMLIQQTIDTDQTVDQSIEVPFNQSELQPELQSSKIMTPDLLKEVNDAKIPKEIKNVSPKKKIIKYVDPKSGKVYYFEMDKTLDLSKVQEIILNPNDEPKKQADKKTNERTKQSNGLNSKNPNSLLKTNVEKKRQSVQSVTKTIHQSQTVFNSSLNHIDNDHCYLGPCFKNKCEQTKEDLIESGYGASLFERLISNVKRFSSVRTAVNYLLKNIPLVVDYAGESDYVKLFPFAVNSVEQFWSLDVAKRRNIEWSRAKLINTVLGENLKTNEPIWRTKEILLFSRLYGYAVLKPNKDNGKQDSNKELTYREWSSLDYLQKTRQFQEKLRILFPNPLQIHSLTEFKMDEFSNLESKNGDSTIDETEIIDVLGDSNREDRRVVFQDEKNSDLMVLPVENVDLKNSFLFIEKKCSELGIDLRNEDIGNGYCYSAVHAVILSAVRSFADEIVRSSLVSKLVATRGFMDVWSSEEERIQELDLRSTLQGVSSCRATVVTPRGLGVVPQEEYRL